MLWFAFQDKMLDVLPDNLMEMNLTKDLFLESKLKFVLKNEKY